MLDIGEEALSSLLTVVADVYARSVLGRNARGGRLLYGPPQLLRIDWLTPAAPAMELSKVLGPREASGVSRENP
jgi:hypothetical protein